MRQVRLTPQALKDLEAFDAETKEKIWSYRVWPYRVLYRCTGSQWLDVLSIEHRKDVYR